MLPTRPNVPAGGLPSGPRSRSVGRSRQRADPTQYNSERPVSSRQIQSQRSIASFPRESTRAGPPSSSRPSEASYHTHSRSYDNRPQPHRSRRSEDSVTSSGSSLFERMRSGAASYASSFTSVDDDDDLKAEDNARGRSLRNRRIGQSETLSPQDVVSDTGTGDGSTIWSRVATAASTLTVSVSQAWASNITTFAGEETPPGQESRLTRAMKAYHIEKARDPSDLPAWLFDEHERQPRVRSRPVLNEEVVRAPAEIPRSRRARQASGSIASTDAMSQQSDQISHRTREISSPPPKGTDRLKALREAKRNAAQAPENEFRSTLHDGQRVARVGLPSGPVVRNRRG